MQAHREKKKKKKNSPWNVEACKKSFIQKPKKWSISEALMPGMYIIHVTCASPQSSLIDTIYIKICFSI